MSRTEYSETREARKDKATLVPNSGRGVLKGDAKIYDYLLDYKHVISTHTIKATAWKKHSKDAWNNGHLSPLYKIIYGENELSLAVVEWNEFVQLKEDAEKYRDLCDG